MNNGKVIAGRYLIKELIGQGGMADVFLARDEILDRDVAIKILRSHLADDAVYVQRFAREASAAATLSHKNIVEIYDVGEDEGQYYIVMEYVPGTTLKELIYKRGALHISEAVDIMRQLISGVKEAHRNGVIHRDLKPQNILITDSGVLKIADFGIAMVQSFAQVTESTTIMGSLHYLSPELVRGEKATPQSDIYALGIIFYELLRGQVPFNDEAAMNIAMKHIREEMPSIREFNPTISQAIENVIIKATAKNKDDRFENADDMLYALDMAIKYPDQDKLIFETKDTSDPTIIFEAKNDQPVKKTLTKEERKRIAKRQKRRKYKYIALGVGAMTLVIIFFLLFNAFFGPSKFKLDDLSGMTIEQAKVLLEEKGLVLDEITRPEEYSDKYEKGKIIKSSPAFGEEVTEGDRIIVTISKGRELKIADYRGRKYEGVAEELEKMGFKVEKNEAQSESYEAGVVINQSIAAGTIVDSNSTLVITLTVSKGYSKLVDSVVGFDIEAAQRILEGQNIKVELAVLPSPTNPDEIAQMKANIVIKQTYENEYINSPNTIVTLYYYDKVVTLPEEKPDPDNPSEEDNQGDQSL